MLYPIATESRVVTDLNGIWKFLIDKEVEPIEAAKPLPTSEVIAVPASFNDQNVNLEIRRHSGYIWYEKEFSVAKSLRN